MNNPTEDKAALDLMSQLKTLSLAAFDFKKNLDNFGKVYGESNELYQKIATNAEQLGNLNAIESPCKDIY